MQSEKLQNGQTIVTIEDGREALVAAYAVSEARGERRHAYIDSFTRTSRLVKKLGQRAGLPAPEAAIRLTPRESSTVIQALVAIADIDANTPGVVHPESYRFADMAADMVAEHPTDADATL